MPQAFNVGEQKTKATETKKLVVQFKVNGQSGEFAHLINHRRIGCPNESMAAFETGLRAYDNKLSKSMTQNEGNHAKQRISDRPKFYNFPKIDRGEFPHYLVTQKEMEKLKKINPVYANENLIHTFKPPSNKLMLSAL